MFTMRSNLIFSLIFYSFFSGNIFAETSYQPTGTTLQSNIYIFAPYPYANPQEVFEDYQAIMRYLEHNLPGTHFQIETSKNYADFESKLLKKHFHFSLTNPYQTVISFKHGYHVIAKMIPDDDYRGLLISRADKELNVARDLIRKKLCFPSETAVAATMLPLLYLKDVQNLNVKKSTEISYVGSQISSILNAYSGEQDACGISMRFWRSWSMENPDKALEMKVLWGTPSLPNNALVARNDIDPKLAHKIASLLSDLSNEKSVDQSQFKVDQQHFEISDNTAYKPMEDFLQRYDQVIGLPSSMQNESSK